MNRTNFIIFIFSFTFLLPSSDEITSIIKVAESLYNGKNFQLAIIEYQRANIIYPKNDYYIQNQEKIAECYMKMGYFIESINIHRSLLDENPKHWNSIFEIPYTYQLMNNFSESNNFIEKQLKYFDNVRKDSLIFLKACNHFALMEIDSSKLFFGSIGELNFRSVVKRNLAIISEFETIKHYNPKSAKYLNVLFPGAGYFYLGMYQTFISTLLVESLFLYSTIVTHTNGYAIGTLLGGLFYSGFYLGSIYGADEFAKKKRNNLYNRFYKKLIFDYKK